MSNHAAGRRCSASVRLGFSGPAPFSESTYYYHGLLGSSSAQLSQTGVETRLDPAGTSACATFRSTSCGSARLRPLSAVASNSRKYSSRYLASISATAYEAKKTFRALRAMRAARPGLADTMQIASARVAELAGGTSNAALLPRVTSRLP